MQITFFQSKKYKTYCHCTNKSQNLNNYTNLTLKTEKQEMNLNYHNALWDRSGFHIAQIGYNYVAESGNVAWLWVISPNC